MPQSAPVQCLSTRQEGKEVKLATIQGLYAAPLSRLACPTVTGLLSIRKLCCYDLLAGRDSESSTLLTLAAGPLHRSLQHDEYM